MGPQVTQTQLLDIFCIWDVSLSMRKPATSRGKRNLEAAAADPESDHVGVLANT